MVINKEGAAEGHPLEVRLDLVGGEAGVEEELDLARLEVGLDKEVVAADLDPVALVLRVEAGEGRGQGVS